eukprot:1738028-Rhodomonas_salina.4
MPGTEVACGGVAVCGGWEQRRYKKKSLSCRCVCYMGSPGSDIGDAAARHAREQLVGGHPDAETAVALHV